MKELDFEDVLKWDEEYQKVYVLNNYFSYESDIEEWVKEMSRKEISGFIALLMEIGFIAGELEASNGETKTTKERINYILNRIEYYLNEFFYKNKKGEAGS